MYTLLKQIGNIRLPISFFGRLILFLQLFLLIIKARYFNTPNAIVKLKIAGQSISAYDYETLYYLLREILLTEDYFFKTEIKNPVIFDCGANIGISVLYFKMLYPESTIVAFEPNPNLYALLDKNVKDNHLKNIELHKEAVSGEAGEISFFINENLGSFLSSKFQHRGGDKEIHVPAVLLSKILEKYPRIDLLKMDIEGSEFEVMHELQQKQLFVRIPLIIVEYHYFKDKDHGKLETFIQLFTDNKYSYSTDKTIDKTLGFQDVVFTFTKKTN